MKKLLLLLIILLLAIPIYIFGENISLLDQYRIIENLKTIFSILFALFGIWIAICNPLTTDNQKLEKIEFNKLLESLFLCIVCLITISLIFFIIPIFKQIHFIVNHRHIFLGILFLSIYFLTLIQIYALVISLMPNNLIKDYLDKKSQKEKILKQQRILKK
ncbi:hypothetical protein [Acinetobacter portensis]|uniref:hypothetical protein n=1 Tax=Acinetobacter portensis TaxID=1839785 RepID=UPI0013D208D7|nr:hypothetical protein [Acinetobacter portensis]